MKRLKEKLMLMPIRYKIAMYFFYFVVIMLLFLWTFQIIFLDSFYKSIKINQIEQSAKSITQNIKNKNLETLIDEIHNQNDINIMLYNTSTNTYEKIYTTEGSSKVSGKNNFISQIDPNLVRYYNKAIANGGTMIEITQNTDKNWKEDFEQFAGDTPPFEMTKTQHLVYAGVFSVEAGQQYENAGSGNVQCMLILTSMITPVNSTVETLRVQLIIVTAILLIIAIGLSILVAKQISKPIIKINKTAKQLAAHNYNVEFKGAGYKEIAELNDTLNYATKELSKVEALRRELIANISHDLRTPLTMITGYGEVMRDLPGENTPENIQIIIDEATHLSTLVSDLLDISKLQSGVVQLDKTDFCLTDSIKQIFNRYSKLKEQDGYNIVFDYDCDVYVNADEIKIGQVVYNLINNAINYAGQDKTVFVRQKVSEDKVKIEIEDHGKGISQDNLKYIWDRYYKVDKAHKSSVIGTGLGLSIVKKMLDLHNAHYGVTSTVDEGSLFWFELKRLDDCDDSVE